MLPQAPKSLLLRRCTSKHGFRHPPFVSAVSPQLPSRIGVLRAVQHLAASSAKSSDASPQGEDPAPAPFLAHHVAFKASLDFKFIKDNVEMLERNCRDRHSSAQPRLVAQLYDEFVQVKQEVDALRAERNENSSAMKGKVDQAVRQQLIQRGQELKEQLAGLEERVAQVESHMQFEGQRVPNLTHPSAPIGAEDNDAAVIRLVGQPAVFDWGAALDHVAVGEALDMLDFEAAAEVSGQKFYYLRGAGALLELALINYAINKAVQAGFTPVTTPDLVKSAVLEKCGFQPRGTNTQVYSVEDSPLCLTGTAEVPLGGMYMDHILTEADLPIRMAAFGHCFRTEAGAAGAAGKGLYRVHQFSKVEMFVLCTPAQSDALHQELIDLEIAMFSELGLHFKVLDMPTGDLGAPAYRKFDVEAWMPGLGRWGEISSASNCTDYQSRRLNIRYRPEAAAAPAAAAAAAPAAAGAKAKKGGAPARTEFVHTLNATACAVPRMIVAILENFQQADGTVIIPHALRPYMGGMETIAKPTRRVRRL